MPARALRSGQAFRALAPGDPSMPEATTPEVQEVTLADLVRTLWRRKWVLLVVFLVVAAGGAAYTFLKTPQ